MKTKLRKTAVPAVAAAIFSLILPVAPKLIVMLWTVP